MKTPDDITKDIVNEIDANDLRDVIAVVAPTINACVKTPLAQPKRILPTEMGLLKILELTEQVLAMTSPRVHAKFLELRAGGRVVLERAVYGKPRNHHYDRATDTIYYSYRGTVDDVSILAHEATHACEHAHRGLGEIPSTLMERNVRVILRGMGFDLDIDSAEIKMLNESRVPYAVVCALGMNSEPANAAEIEKSAPQIQKEIEWFQKHGYSVGICDMICHHIARIFAPALRKKTMTDGYFGEKLGSFDELLDVLNDKSLRPIEQLEKLGLTKPDKLTHSLFCMADKKAEQAADLRARQGRIVKNWGLAPNNVDIQSTQEYH